MVIAGNTGASIWTGQQEDLPDLRARARNRDLDDASPRPDPEPRRGLRTHVAGEGQAPYPNATECLLDHNRSANRDMATMATAAQFGQRSTGWEENDRPPSPNRSWRPSVEVSCLGLDPTGVEHHTGAGSQQRTRREHSQPSTDQHRRKARPPNNRTPRRVEGGVSATPGRAHGRLESCGPRKQTTGYRARRMKIPSRLPTITRP